MSIGIGIAVAGVWIGAGLLGRNTDHAEEIAFCAFLATLALSFAIA